MFKFLLFFYSLFIFNTFVINVNNSPVSDHCEQELYDIKHWVWSRSGFIYSSCIISRTNTLSKRIL